MNRREALKIAAIGTAANSALLMESQGGEKHIDRFDQLLRKPAPCTHTLEMFRPDGQKEVIVQEGGSIHPQLIQHFREQVDKLTNADKGTVSTKIICHGNVTRIEIEQISFTDVG